MWKLRALVVSGVLAGIMVVGLAVAVAGWSWNAELDVEGTETHVNWTVIDDADGSAYYTADINVDVPNEAQASVVSSSPNETVSIGHSKKLSCTANGIESKVTVNVSDLPGADGDQAMVTVYAGSNILGSNTGRVGKNIKLNVLIPGSC